MTQITGREAPSNSLIEVPPPQCGPSALTLVNKVDEELKRLDAKEAEIGRSTSYTRWCREQLLQRREVMANMVN